MKRNTSPDLYSPELIELAGKSITVRHEEILWLINPQNYFIKSKVVKSRLEEYALALKIKCTTSKSPNVSVKSVFFRDELGIYRQSENPDGEVKVVLHPLEIQRLYFMNYLLVRWIMTSRVLFQDHQYRKELEIFQQRLDYLKKEKELLSYQKRRRIEKAVDELLQADVNISTFGIHTSEVFTATNTFMVNRSDKINQSNIKPLF